MESPNGMVELGGNFKSCGKGNEVIAFGIALGNSLQHGGGRNGGRQEEGNKVPLSLKLSESRRKRVLGKKELLGNVVPEVGTRKESWGRRERRGRTPRGDAMRKREGARVKNQRF